jgi:hypothetical protein
MSERSDDIVHRSDGKRGSIVTIRSMCSPAAAATIRSVELRSEAAGACPRDRRVVAVHGDRVQMGGVVEGREAPVPAPT